MGGSRLIVFYINTFSQSDTQYNGKLSRTALCRVQCEPRTTRREEEFVRNIDTEKHNHQRRATCNDNNIHQTRTVLLFNYDSLPYFIITPINLSSLFILLIFYECYISRVIMVKADQFDYFHNLIKYAISFKDVHRSKTNLWVKFV